MNLYSFRNLLTGNGAVWLKLNTSDLENMAKKAVAHKSLKLGGKNILDLGCGTGTMLSYLHREEKCIPCLLYTSPSPRDLSTSRMPSSA